MSPRPGRESVPPGEHDPELPDGTTQDDDDRDLQEENAETSLDEPSQ